MVVLLPHVVGVPGHVWFLATGGGGSAFNTGAWLMMLPLVVAHCGALVNSIDGAEDSPALSLSGIRM